MRRPNALGRSLLALIAVSVLVIEGCTGTPVPAACQSAAPVVKTAAASALPPPTEAVASPAAVATPEPTGTLVPSATPPLGSDLKGIDVCKPLTPSEVKAVFHHTVRVASVAALPGECSWSWGNFGEFVYLELLHGNAMACGASTDRYNIGDAACPDASGVQVFGKGWTFKLSVPLVPPVSLGHENDQALKLARHVYARLPVAYP